jgi:hypothetical protein
MRLPSDFQNLSKSITLLILSFGFGAANGLGIIGAPSYLLSRLNPNFGLLAVFTSGISFFLFQRFIFPRKIKFGDFSVRVVGVFIILLLSLIRLRNSESLCAFAWLYLSFFGLRLSKWVVSELTTLHLAPLRAKSFFFYHSVFHEGGIVAAMVGLKLASGGLNPLQMIEASFILYSICLFLMALQYGGKKCAEWKSAALPSCELSLVEGSSKSLSWGIRWVALTIGMAVLCEEQLVRVVLKDRLGSFEALRDLMANYRLVGSFILIFLGFAAGRWIQRKQPSPFRLLWLNAFGLMVLTTLCLSTRWFFVFVAFEVAKRILEQTLYAPANNMIFSSFLAPFRNKMRSLEAFYYFTGASLLLLLFFHFIQGWGVSGQTSLTLSFILLFLGLHSLILFWFRLRVSKAALSSLALVGRREAELL